jgi:hypothetical protein
VTICHRCLASCMVPHASGNTVRQIVPLYSLKYIDIASRCSGTGQGKQPSADLPPMFCSVRSSKASSCASRSNISFKEPSLGGYIRCPQSKNIATKHFIVKFVVIIACFLLHLELQAMVVTLEVVIYSQGQVLPRRLLLEFRNMESSRQPCVRVVSRCKASNVVLLGLVIPVSGD